MDFHRLVVSALCIFMQVNLICCDTRSRKFGFMKSERKIKEGYITGEVTNSSLVSCATLCSVIKQCFTISFNSVTWECLYSKREVIHGTPSTYFVHESGWTSISKKEYTVFLRTGPSGYYSLTWPEAVEICASENTSMANETDLMVSRALGFGICSCWWLSSGQAGYVLQQQDYDSGCTAQPFTTGIFTCGFQRMNVFCLIKDHH